MTGDAAKTGPCVTVNVPAASLDRVTATSCSTAILVNAPNVKITNSEITGNGVGVKVANGIEGAKVLRSKVYGNTEGIVTLEEASAPIFFDGDTKDTKDIFPVDADISKVIDYADRPVYLNIPLNGSASSEEDANIEFLLSNTKDIEGIELVNKDKVDIVKPAKELANKAERYKIPAEYLNKPLVAIYTDPIHGTTGFSQRFTTSAGDVVAFVSSPFDMTTSGGSNMEGIDVANVDVQGVDVGAGGGSTGVAGATAASGGCGKAELVPGGSARTVDVAMALWWILFSAAIVTTTRTVKARSKNR
mgnify:FL=1